MRGTDPDHATHFFSVQKATPESSSVNSGELIDVVVQLLQTTFHPTRVMKGGSEGKNTAVEGSDIDLVVVLPDFDSKQGKGYCKTALDALQTASDSILKVTRPTSMKVNVSIGTDIRDIDVLFTGDPKDNRHDNPTWCYNSYYTLEQVQFVKDKKTEHAGLHDTIIELKIWAKAQTLGIPGYFIELLCIKEFDARGKHANAATVKFNQGEMHSLICPVTASKVELHPVSREAFRSACQGAGPK